MKSSVRSCLLCLAMVAGLLAFSIYSVAVRHAMVAPPAQGTDLISFLDARPVFSIFKFVRGGKVHFEVVGENPMPLLSLPSGPPVYLFDAGGALVVWTPDVGDDPVFRDTWWRPDGATELTAAAAKAEVQARRFQPK